MDPHFPDIATEHFNLWLGSYDFYPLVSLLLVAANVAIAIYLAKQLRNSPTRSHGVYFMVANAVILLLLALFEMRPRLLLFLMFQPSLSLLQHLNACGIQIVRRVFDMAHLIGGGIVACDICAIMLLGFSHSSSRPMRTQTSGPNPPVFDQN